MHPSDNNNTPETSGSEPLIVQPSLDRKELLDIVFRTFPDGEAHGDWLLYRRHMLRVKIEFGEMRCVEGTYSVQLLFIVQHPWFDEDLVEIVMGYGDDPDDAMCRGTKQFCMGVMQYLLDAFDDRSDTLIKSDVRGQEHIFRLPSRMGCFHLGEGEETDLYAVIKDKLPEYLGTKRCYWVSLHSSIMNGMPVCEARVNGAVCNGLTELLLQDVAGRLDAVRFASDRQFVLLIQEESTWKPCPFTKQEVGEFTFRALRLMQEITDPESGKQTLTAIRNGASSYSLGAEVVAFIPEIVCQYVIRFMDNDALMPVVNYGKPDCELKKTQVRSYGYIDDAVFQYLHKQKPSQDDIRNLLALSGKFHTINEGIQRGVKIEDLKLSQFVYFVNEHYEVW